MKILLFGATGGTGSQLVTQTLAAGHRLTVFARKPESIVAKSANLSRVQSDIFDADAVCRVMPGHDVVLSAVGPGRRGPTTIYSQGIVNLLDGMQKAGINRLVCTSAIAISPDISLPFPLNWVMRLVVRPLLREGFEDAVQMEQILADSDCDWTVVRAPMLTNGPQTGRYRTAVNRHLHHGVRVSRADLADYMLKLISDPAAYRAWVEIAY